ncbi:MAG TPA: DUF3823 domain-containing protein [Chitinophagaceae bacterium]|nr:DUF3823 domain-containing protein [Chitinophagaceae bacterium]
MKIKLHYIILFACMAGFLSCKKDNYDAPSSTLSGKLVYNGESFGLEKDQVPFQLYQYGFGKVGPIGASFTQEGTYSAVLFDGEYKLIVPNGQGPFLWKQTPDGKPDTVVINLKGSQVLDLQVTPYYMIRNSQISAAGGNVNATFKVDKIITDANAKDIDNVTLYINKTQFVSPGNNIATAGIGGSAIVDPNNITLTVAIPSISPAQNYVFARVGLKIAGVEDRIFSPVQKIQL